MIKRTPQEIADFFQCYVAQQGCGDWTLFNKRPSLKNSFGVSSWQMNDADDGYSWLLEGWVDVPADHHWTHLYEPRLSTKSENSILDTRNQPETAENSVITSDSGTNQQEANYQKEADSDNKPDSYYQNSPKVDNKPGHLGEVYIHKEYKLISETNPKSLEAEVSKYLSNGWKLFGPPFKGEDCYGDVLLIQPMVRGV